MSDFIPDDQFKPDEEQPFTMAGTVPAPGQLNPNASPQQFLGQVLNRVIGDTPQEEGIQPIMSPIDFLAPGVVGAAVEAAPRLLANEVGSIGPGVAQQVEKSLAERIREKAIQRPEGGLTNNAAAQQAGTPFQEGSKAIAKEWQAAGKVNQYAEGGFVSDADFQADPTPMSQSPQSGQNVSRFVSDDQFIADDASEDERTVQRYLAQQEKYGTLPQQALAAAEGVGEGLAGPLFTAAEVALGADRENILGRKEANPMTSMGGQATGLVGGAFLGTTEARAIPTLAGIAEKAGAKVAAKVLPETTTAVSKIGSAATKAAIENMVIQGSNEASKMILKDPKQSVETAVTDIGLAGLIGGGLGGAVGSVSPLWKATLGKQTEGTLNAITDKMGGIDGINKNVIDDAIKAAGLPEDLVTPEIRASLEQGPLVQQHAQILMDAATDSGVKFQSALKDFKRDMSKHALEVLGKTDADVAALKDLDANAIGSRIRDVIKNDLNARYEPISKSYDEIAGKFKQTEIPEESKTILRENIAKMFGDVIDDESAQARYMFKALKHVDKLENLEHLRQFASKVGEETGSSFEMMRVGRTIKNAIHDAEESALNKLVGEQAPELFERHMATNKAYKELKGVIGDINDRLKVGDRGGLKTFIKNLDNADPETLLNRLNPTGKADIIAELSQRFPQVAQEVRDYQLGKILKVATKNVDEGVNINSLTREVNKMSPQMRDFLFGKEALGKVEALKALVEHLPEKVGKSGTPQGLDGLLKYVPGSAIGLSAVLNGANLVSAGIAGHLAKVVGRDAPDAMRLSLLRFLGTNKPVSGTGFKAMVDYVHAAAKGENLTGQAVKNIFKASRQVIPQGILPTHRDREKLDKQLESLRSNPNGLFNVGGETAHYMEDHGAAIGQTAMTAVNYLNSIRPQNDPKTPLGKKLPLNPVQKASYDRALNIAQQPLVVLNHIKNGTLLPSDVVAIKSMYPALYNKLSQKLTSEMVEQTNKGKDIPYTTRLGLSMFLAQPMDGTLTPEAIQSAQATNAVNQQQKQMNNQDTLRPSQQGMKSLSKSPSNYQTPLQARAESRQSDT